MDAARADTQGPPSQTCEAFDTISFKDLLFCGSNLSLMAWRRLAAPYLIEYSQAYSETHLYHQFEIPTSALMQNSYISLLKSQATLN